MPCRIENPLLRFLFQTLNPEAQESLYSYKFNPRRQFLLFETDFLKNGPVNFFCFRRQGSVSGPLQDSQISLFPKVAQEELFSF